MLHDKRGFTLLELIIIMVILGVLAGLISGNLLNSLKKGRDSQRKSDLAQVKNALELFYEDMGEYPKFAITWEGKLCQTSACGANEKVYMYKLPKDPKNPTLSYSYNTDANGTYYRLYSCLENPEQVLNTVSTNNGSFTCAGYNCKDSTGATVACIWGVASSNTLP